MFVLKMAVLQSWVERTALQNSAIQNIAGKYSSSDVSTIVLTDEQIFTVVILKKT